MANPSARAIRKAAALCQAAYRLSHHALADGYRRRLDVKQAQTRIVEILIQGDPRRRVV
jgi:hypothetical protein